MKFNKNNIPNIVGCCILLFIVIVLIYTIIKYRRNNRPISIEDFNDLEDYYIGGMNRADQILFINLENRKDRLESITKQMKEQKIQMDKVHRINAHYTPGNGHLGCAKSHLDAIKYASKMGYENVIVLEDDFKFSTKPDETHAALNNLLDKVPQSEWDVVLFTHVAGKEEETKYPFIKKITGAQTSSGYIVNKKYYPVMISIFQKCVNNMTQEKTSGVKWEHWALDQVWKENQREDRWFTFKPFIGKQDEESVSTIQQITNYN